MTVPAPPYLPPKRRKIITSTKKKSHILSALGFIALSCPRQTWCGGRVGRGRMWGEGERQLGPTPLFLGLPNPPPLGSALVGEGTKPAVGAQPPPGCLRRRGWHKHLYPPAFTYCGQLPSLIPFGKGSHGGSSSTAAWKRLVEEKVGREGERVCAWEVVGAVHWSWSPRGTQLTCFQLLRPDCPSLP